MPTHHRKTARNTGLALLLLGSLAAAPGWTAPGDGHHGADPERMLTKMSRHLDLSQEQQDRVSQLLAQAHEAGAADRERMQALRGQLRDQQSNFDAGTAQALADELGQITARSSFRRAETRAGIYQLLDDSQRQKLERMEAKRHKHRFKRGPQADRQMRRED
ncbi:Spy/CpxP family protein refolding chaperone [Kineobactrum salinum]|uniref:Periplasmic heavy metal sensor n=1 Tax=Kineobactrum salinum TaxID=2708301 RepID=A0A6C0U408_9GAMM|nr:Spy/CpxP family protein refolding chaperone [Kineobactrum salinum]QIB64174.1 periplasmic heavy metal sensor [Kineobactrum salinum]